MSNRIPADMFKFTRKFNLPSWLYPKWTPRPLVAPYTHAAMIGQTHFVYEFKNAWMIRFFFYSCIITQPLWWWLTKVNNAPEWVAACEARKRAEHEKEKIKHMWDDISGEFADK